jgi:DNA-binding SARP family transcriptional activator
MSTLSVSSPIEGVQEPSLRVYLLGTPIIEWQGENINIPRRNVRCLLYRLGVALGERGGAVSREQLCVLFWPDSPDAVARRNLSHLLTHLRRALPDPELLQTLHGNVCLDPDRTWSDTAFCERACSRRSKSNPVEMEQASQYYRGPFLHGCSLPKGLEFDAWVTKSRNFYERQYLELLSALIDIYRQKGEYAAAITSARRYLETDELAEAIHRKLIELYMTAGDSKAARRQLEACITVLERELGVSPMPETWAACQPVVQSRPIITPHPRMSAQMAALAQGLPFVSREKELDLLKGQLDRASAGQSVFVLICGEPGIGKSRLMDLFASLCRGRALVLESICSPGARTLPYLPLAEAMRGA